MLKLTREHQCTNTNTALFGQKVFEWSREEEDTTAAMFVAMLTPVFWIAAENKTLSCLKLK